MPPSPGVYRMLNAAGETLYVGKARDLKKRVANYTHIGNLPNWLRRMVAETRAMEVVLTHTEVEALLLECNLIKRFMPRYNVLLRDDKSFPYIHLTAREFPQITKHRGATALSPAIISGRSPRPARSPARWWRCSAPSCCAHAPTAIFRAAPALACSISSSAAARLASAASTRRATTSWSRMRARSSKGAARTCRRGSPRA